MERTINQEILNNVDVNVLLERFTAPRIAFVFAVKEEYVYKTARTQKETKSQFKMAEEEMNYGMNGEWSELKNTELYRSLKN